MRVLEQRTKVWLDTIRRGLQRKEEQFGKYAELCWKFYASPNHDFVFMPSGADSYNPYALSLDAPKVTINKTFEMVDVFLPFLHHQNPTRVMSDRRAKVPNELKLALQTPEAIRAATQQYYAMAIQHAQQMAAVQGMPFNQMAAMASMPPPGPQELAAILIPPDPQEPIRMIRRILLENYLNYTPQELDLKSESYRGLTEALVAGRGVWWTEAFHGHRGLMIGTFNCPVEDFVVDPDHCEPRNWAYVGRRRRKSRQQLLSLRPHLAEWLESRRSGTQRTGASISDSRPDNRHDVAKRHADTQEQIEYWEIYSRCGLGDHLLGTADELSSAGLGDNVYLEVCEDYPHGFLNVDHKSLEVPDEARKQEAMNSIVMALQWPLRVWRDPVWPWPFALCDFHMQNNSAWPISHLRPALGEQMMLDWIWSYVAEHIKRTSQGKWLYNQDLPPDTLEQLQRAVDQIWVPVKLKHQESLRDVALYIQAGELKKDLWTAAQGFERLFEMRTGMNELLAMGQFDRQMRSAAEATITERYSQSRPESMAERYEDTQSRVARNEAIAARLLLDAPNIASFFEEPYDPSTVPATVGEYTRMWQQCVYSQDEDAVMAETDYRIESGSMMKPNVQEIAQGADKAYQMLQPFLQAEFQAGNPSNLNALISHMAKYNIVPSDIQFQPLPPPAAPVPPQEKT